MLTSGLSDDSRVEVQRAAERRLRDLRGRVGAARADVSRTPGLEEVLASDGQKGARFYARFGITETQRGWVCHISDSCLRTAMLLGSGSPVPCRTIHTGGRQLWLLSSRPSCWGLSFSWLSSIPLRVLRLPRAPS